LPELLDKLVRLVEESSVDDVIASVLLADADGAHLRHGAAPSLPPDCNDAIDGIEVGPAAGSCGTAAYRREPVVVVDIDTDPLCQDFRELARKAGVRACWSIPLLARGKLLGTFAMYYPQPRGPSSEDGATAAMFAHTAALAIERTNDEQSRLAALEVAQRMSEALQRSLLTRPVHPPHLALAVRYLPAVEQAKIGGDWYDAFVTAAGMSTLVIGDVNGHDRDAAAGMAQVRNLVRGLAYDADRTPAALLSRLDAALAAFGVGTLATAIVAHAISPPDPSGTMRLRWSNAGHLPPLLCRPDGSVDVLETCSDLLLGLSSDTARHDSEVDLPAGATLLLYTDGLVERRGEDLDRSITHLARTLQELGDLPLDQLCNALVDRLLPDGGDDDVALLAVRPRWAESGPVARARGGPAGGHQGHHLHVAAETAAVPAARRFTAGVCDAAGIQPNLKDTAVLLISELVTNAVVHTASSAELTI
jgi:serine phosphatase RsbU (regulator of sigma subunit)